MNAHVSTGQNPMILAKKIHRIILKKNIKSRYIVGSNLQKLSIFLKKALPAKWFEKILKNHYKLN